MTVIFRVDQLRGDPRPVTGARYGSFDHRVHVKLLGDCAQRRVCPTIPHRRSLGDYSETADPGQIGGECVSHAIGEVILRRVAGQVSERQNYKRCDVWRLLKRRTSRPPLLPGPNRCRHQSCDQRQGDGESTERGPGFESVGPFGPLRPSGDGWACLFRGGTVFPTLDLSDGSYKSVPATRQSLYKAGALGGIA